jgi:hypothetical protein
VDVYNSATGIWSTAQLSVARRFLVAISVGNLAMVAGGHSGRTLASEAWLADDSLCLVLECSRILLHAVWSLLAASCTSLQGGIRAAHQMLSTCTTVRQGLGRQLSSALGAIVLQPHPSGTLLFLLEVTYKVHRYTWCKIRKRLCLLKYT